MSPVLQDWLKAAGVRAVKTAAQVGVTYLGSDLLGYTHTNWAVLGVLMGGSALFSLLTSLAGLPELKNKQDEANPPK